jgi:hypothetical protein
VGHKENVASILSRVALRREHLPQRRGDLENQNAGRKKARKVHRLVLLVEKANLI